MIFRIVLSLYLFQFLQDGTILFGNECYAFVPKMSRITIMPPPMVAPSHRKTSSSIVVVVGATPRPQPQQRQQEDDEDDEYYYYNNFNDDERNDSREDTRTSRRFREMNPPRSDPNDWFRSSNNNNNYNNYNIVEPSLRKSPQSKQQSLQKLNRYKTDQDDDELYYDNDYEYDDEDNNYFMNEYQQEQDTLDNEPDMSSPSTPGNFWFNAAGTTTTSSSSSSSSPAPTNRRRESFQKKRVNPPFRPTSFRSGIPPPPEPLLQLYNKLFWYGLDASRRDDDKDNNYGDDDASTSLDRTMFGGTRGKFNGLAYLQDLNPDSSRNRYAKRYLKPIDTRDGFQQDEDDYDDNYDYDNTDDTDGDYDNIVAENEPEAKNNGNFVGNRDPARYAQVKPPSDVPRAMPFDQAQRVPSRPSTRVKRQKRDNRKDWVSNQVSSWFDYDSLDQNPGRRRRRKQQEQNEENIRDEPSSSSPFNIIDSLFGFNQQERDRKAAMYNERMGLNQKNNDNNPRVNENRRRRQRSGYAYRYKEEDDSNEPPVADYEVIPESEYSGVKQSSKTPENVETVNGPDRTTDEQDNDNPHDNSEKSKMGRVRLSWEERALAIERVPPANVMAWGPSGVLPTDARTLAISDALQDLIQAQRKLALRQKHVDQAKEALGIARVDVELAMARAAQQVERLEQQVENASREYRWAIQLQQLAQEELSELEKRHWAVLQFYNPAQAEEKVREMLQEFPLLNIPQSDKEE